MYRNQFFATTGNVAVPFQNWQHLSTGLLRIFAEPALELTSAAGSSHVVVLGIILDPHRPERSGLDIVDELAQSCTRRTTLIDRLAHLCGRYVTIATTQEGCFALGDACGFRSLLYGTASGDFHLGSNLKLMLEMLGVQPEQTPDVSAHISSARFDHREHAWFGDATQDRRFWRVLPNHLLDIEKRRTERLPVEDLPASRADETTIVKRFATVMSGSIAALHHRKPIIIPLSAGLDTRMLLAASRQVADSVTYYTVADASQPTDTRIAREIASRLHLPFVELKLKSIGPELESAFRRSHLHPRLLRNARFIQALADRWSEGEVTNVTGNGAEVLRCYYGHTSGHVSTDMLRTFSGYGRTSSLVDEAIEAWLPEARKYARCLGISLLDLFYWEQRLGNWGAAFPGELDVMMDEVSPFNQRAMLLEMLRVPAMQRNAPDYALFRRLIGSLWPDVLDIPVNPDTPAWKKRVLSNAYLRYLLQKTGVTGA